MSSPGDSSQPWQRVTAADYLRQGPGVKLVHYCQSYWIGESNEYSSPKKGGFNFHKGHVPRHILERCDMPLLKPLEKFYTIDEAKAKDPDDNKGHTYMLHWVYKGINAV